MRIEDRKMLMDLLLKASIEDVEFVILAKRYGLDEKEPVKPRQLASQLSMPEWQIRKVCQLALLKLRTHTDDAVKEQFDRLLLDLISPRKS